MAGAWAHAVKNSAYRTTPFQLAADDIAPHQDNLNPAGLFLQDIDFTPHVDPHLLARLEEIKRQNVETYCKEHPHERPVPTPASIGKSPDSAENLDMKDPTDEHSSATIKKMKLKLETVTPALKLFFAVVDTGERSVVAPEINPALHHLYQKASTFANFVVKHGKALVVHVTDHCTNRDYLHRSVDMP